MKKSMAFLSRIIAGAAAALAVGFFASCQLELGNQDDRASISGYAVTGIEVTGQTKSFEKGSDFTFGDNVTITATYGDGTTKSLDVEDVSVTGFSSAAVSDAVTVTVSYTSGGKTVTTSYDVKVTNAVKSIAVTKQPTKTSYSFIASDESLLWETDITGMVVTATYSDDSTGVLDNSLVTVDKVKSVKGAQNLTVTYNTLTTTLTVDVVDAKVDDKGFSTSFTQTGDDWAATNPVAPVAVDADSGVAISYAYTDLAEPGCDTWVLMDVTDGKSNFVQAWNGSLANNSMAGWTGCFVGSGTVEEGYSWASFAGTHYITMSYNKDLSATCYIDGKKAVTYPSTLAITGTDSSTTVGAVVQVLLDGLTKARDGASANLTPVTTSHEIHNVVFTRAVNDVEAAEIYKTYGQRTE